MEEKKVMHWIRLVTRCGCTRDQSLGPSIPNNGLPPIWRVPLVNTKIAIELKVVEKYILPIRRFRHMHDSLESIGYMHWYQEMEEEV